MVKRVTLAVLAWIALIGFFNAVFPNAVCWVPPAMAAFVVVLGTAIMLSGKRNVGSD